MKTTVASLVPVEPAAVGIVVAVVFFAWAGRGRPGSAPKPASPPGPSRRRAGVPSTSCCYRSAGSSSRRHREPPGWQTSRSPTGPALRSPTRPRSARSCEGSASSCLCYARHSPIRAAGIPIPCISGPSASTTASSGRAMSSTTRHGEQPRRWGIRALISDGAFARYRRPRTRPRRGTSTRSATATTAISTARDGLTRFTRPVPPDPRSGGRARTSNIRLQRPTFCRLNYPGRKLPTACLQQ